MIDNENEYSLCSRFRDYSCDFPETFLNRDGIERNVISAQNEPEIIFWTHLRYVYFAKV